MDSNIEEEQVKKSHGLSGDIWVPTAKAVESNLPSEVRGNAKAISF
jgi:hypothetical protein